MRPDFEWHRSHQVYLSGVLLFALSHATLAADTAPGAPLFEAQCSGCHLGQFPRAPHKTFLQMMSPDAIVTALTNGVMKGQGAALNEVQKHQVAEYLAGPVDKVARKAAPRCEGTAAAFDLTRAPRILGWGMNTRNTRWIAPEIAGLTAREVPRLELKWAFEYPGALRARSQPTVAMGAVFVGSQDGTVYSLDAATGCVRWTFRASAEVRTPVAISTWKYGERPSGKPTAFFGDLLGRVYALDATTGESKWVTRADDHPNATITGGVLYSEGHLIVPVSSLEVVSAMDPKYECCTFRGSVVALDASTGRELWKAYSVAEAPREAGRTSVGTRVLAPSGAPVWNSPTLDVKRSRIYFGTGENYSSPADGSSDAIVALNASDGSRLWVQQKTRGDAWNGACTVAGNPNCPAEKGPDLDFGAGTLLGRTGAGADVILGGQKSGTVHALDPDKEGAALWSVRVGRGGIQGGVHFGMAAKDGRVFVPISDTSDTYFGNAYKEPARPGLYALDIATGRTVWSTPADNVCAGRENCEPGISAAITALDDVVFAGHLDGRFRAYDANDGKVLWETDTARDYVTVSGTTAHGGTLEGPGAIVEDGMVYVNSGYGLYFKMPGNVLLAFAAGAEEKR